MREQIFKNNKDSEHVSTTKQIDDMAFSVSKQKNFNAMDSYNKSCCLQQGECLGRIVM